MNRNSYFIVLVIGFFIFDINGFGQEAKTENRTDNDVKSIEYFFAFTEATKYFLFGNYAQAVSLYNECLKVKPKSSAVHYQLSKIYLNAGKVYLASEHAKKACKFSSENKWFLKQLADIYQVEQEYDSAIIIFKRLLIIDPENINNNLTIAALYEKIGNSSEALLNLDLIDSKIGVSKEVSVARYRILYSLKLYKPALEQLMKAFELSGEEYSITGMIAEFYRSQHEIDSTYKYYRKIYPTYKNDPVVVFSYAEFLLEQRNIDDAKKLLFEVINDISVENIVKSGYFLKVIQDKDLFTLAEPLIDTLVTAYYLKYYDDIRTMSIYSDIEVRLGNYQKASNSLRRIVSADNSNYMAFEQLIYTLNMLGQADSVIYYSGEAISRFSDKPILYLFNGSAKLQSAEFADACKVLESGLALAEDSAIKLEFYSLLAECYQNLQQYSKSVNAFNSALKIDSKNLAIKNNYAYYLALRGENLRFARRMSGSTIEIQKENSTYLDTYAWILFKMKKYAKAKIYIIKALKYGGETNDEILVHCGEIFVSLKAYNEAINFFKRAMLLVKPTEKESLSKRISEVQSYLGK